MSDDNESQAQDAAPVDPPRSSHETAAATNGVKRIHKGGWPSRTAATKVDVLAQPDHGVQHLTNLLEQTTSDLDQEVNRLKAVRGALDTTRRNA